MSERKTKQVLVSQEPVRRHRGDSDRQLSAQLFILGGTAFALVGIVDLALLWGPIRLGSLSWEVATVGRTLDSLPMTALGLLLATYGVYRHPRTGRRSRRSFAILFAVLAILLLVLAALYATFAPAVLSEAPAEAVDAIRKATIRHAVQSVVYPIAFGWIAILLWRGSRAKE